MKKKEFLSAGAAARALGVSVKTIQRWDKAGLLPVIRTATNQRRIPVDAVERICKAAGPMLRCAIYARVSSAKEEREGKLTRQVEGLQHVARERGYQVVALISEQASPFNEGRRGMQRLLSLIDQQAIDVVLIDYPDRLVHFGFGYLEEAFGWKQVRLEVVEPPKAQTPTEELVADLLSMVTVVSGRLSESRANNIQSCVSHALRDCLKRDAEETDGTGCENHQTPAGSL